MIFLIFHPKQDGQEIYCKNEYLAQKAALEVGTYFYYPVKNQHWSRLKTVVLHENGEWIKKPMSEVFCTCGCNL